MKHIDYGYLARSMAGLSGVPVRVYRNKVLLCSSFTVSFPKDPIAVCLDEVSAITAHVGYHVTEMFHYYAVLNNGIHKIVVGPTSQVMADEQSLRKLAFDAGVSRDEVPEFIDGMRSIPSIPVESLLQTLCLVNHFLNCGEKLELSDLTINENELMAIKTDVESSRTARTLKEEDHQQHNTLAIEEKLMGIVRNGDTVALKTWLAEATAIQGGIVAGNQLRQLRNLFIVTATLASRAAIGGGMHEDDAFSLSDAYIQRAELLMSHGSIMNLQYHMLLDFTEQVEKLHVGKHATRLSLEVANYIRHHISEPVRVEDLADELFISRPYLSAKFKKETGKSLTDFILSEKTEEAKRLLRYSDKTSAAIAAYLGFSSQGHFCRVFRTYAGMTPNEYREKHR